MQQTKSVYIKKKKKANFDTEIMNKTDIQIQNLKISPI